ncbi:MAG: transcriptional regulator [Thermoplasmata archaeon]
MNRLQLIKEVREALAKSGFYITDSFRDRGISFDLVARKDEELIVIRVLLNADSSRIDNANELKRLASALDASPLFIAVNGGRRELEKGVVYTRRGIPLISLETLKDMVIEGIPPYVFSAPGGFYVQLDSNLFKKIRKKKQISLKKLAEIAGVSRKSIQKYENGMGADLEVAIRLEEFLGGDLIMPLNPLEKAEIDEKDIESINKFKGLSRFVFESLNSFGYEVIPTCKCPFEAVTSDDDTILLSGIGSKGNEDIKNKAKIVSNLSKITEKDSVFFIKKRYTQVNIEGIPVIEKKELFKIDTGEKMKEILNERKGDS